VVLQDCDDGRDVTLSSVTRNVTLPLWSIVCFLPVASRVNSKSDDHSSTHYRTLPRPSSTRSRHEDSLGLLIVYDVTLLWLSQPPPIRGFLTRQSQPPTHAGQSRVEAA
jgi:hypothetical protein